MNNQPKLTYQSARIPLIIKSKYFGQYQPQLYIASRSKSKQQNKQLSSTKQKEKNTFFQQKSQKLKQSQLSQQFKSAKQNLNQKKPPISLQRFLKSRKKNNNFDESASAKIFNWIQKRIVNMQFIQDNSSDMINSSTQINNFNFAQKIRRIAYNLYIIKKAGKSSNTNDIFQQLGMQSIKINKNTKENVIEQIQQQKKNYKRQNSLQSDFAYGDLNKNRQGCLKTISQSQNQDYSSRINKNQLTSQGIYKLSGLSYQEYVKNFQFDKVKNQQTSNTLNNFRDEQIQLKQSCQVSIDEQLSKQNEKLHTLNQSKSNLFNQNNQYNLNQLLQKSVKQSAQQFSQVSKIQQSKNIVIGNLKKYMRETAVCDSDNFFASIFAYEVKPETLIPFQPLQIAEQTLQQQHENYDPFQNSHSQMLNITNSKNVSHSQISKKKTTPAHNYIQSNLIGNIIEQNHQKQKEVVSKKLNKDDNNLFLNSSRNKAPQNIQSYYFSQKNISSTPQIQINYKSNQHFTFQNILEIKPDYNNQNKFSLKQRPLVSPFQKPHLVQDVRMNQFLRQKKQVQKSECSSKKSSKPKVIFHYLSPNQNINRQKPLIKISLKSNKEDQTSTKPKINQNIHIIEMNNLINKTPFNFQQIKTRQINVMPIHNRKSQSQIPLPMTRYRSQTKFTVSNQTCKYDNQIFQRPIVQINKDYFPPNKPNFNYNYVSVPNKTKKYEQNSSEVQQSNANVRQSQCFTRITQICGIQNRFVQVPKKRARSLNQKLLVTCAKHPLM